MTTLRFELLLDVNELWDALAPRPCVACEGPNAGREGLGGWLCPSCLDEVPPRLGRLGRPPALVAEGYALGPYAGPLGALVRHGKYGGDAAALDALGATLAAAAGELEVDQVVPVPGSFWRRLLRGVEPVGHLARPVATRLERPLLPALGRRHRAPQAAQLRRDRAAHARGVFRARAAVAGRVLLVNDVCTTGATASACATELLGAGAAEVVLLTVAAVRFS